MNDMDKLKIIKSLNSANIFIDGAINKHLKAETFLDLESHSLSCINIVKKTEPVESKAESTLPTVGECKHVIGNYDKDDVGYIGFIYCPLCGVKL